MLISLTLKYLKSENGILFHHNLQARHVFLLLCQFANYMEVVRLPVYYPSEQEKEDPRFYANNVRKLLATEVSSSFAKLVQHDYVCSFNN